MPTCPAPGCSGRAAYRGMSRESPARYLVVLQCEKCGSEWSQVVSAEEAHRLREGAGLAAPVLAEGTKPKAAQPTEPRLLVFLSAPVRPIEGETVESNLARTRNAYKWLCRKHPGATFLAPWILNCEVFTETPDEVAIGMRRNKRVIEACDELWLLGNRLSSGMKQEATWARELGKRVCAAGWDKLEAEEWKG